MTHLFARTARQARCDDGQIVDDHAPAEPAFQADFTAVAAAIQLAGAPQVTDAPFDAGSKAQGGAEPGLGLMRLSRGILMARLGQGDEFNPGLLGYPLIGGRKDAAVGGGELGWMTKQLLVLVDTGRPLLLIGRIATQQP